MKLTNILILLLSTLFILPACLKDKDVEDGKMGLNIDENKKIVEMMAPLSGLLVKTLDASGSEVTFSAFSVRLSAEQPAQQDISVTLQLDPGAVQAYNVANGANYTVLPANLYSIQSLVVTIPKGSRTADLKIKAVPNNIAGTPYALGFTISAISDPSIIISGNYKTLVAAIGVKNEYEGNYKAVGFFEHPTAPRSFNITKYVSTVGATMSESLMGDLGGTYIVITVNPSDYTVTIGPGTGTSGSTATVVKLDGDPVFNNKYDPVSKTFKLKYGYPNPGPTRIITETLTRL